MRRGEIWTTASNLRYVSKPRPVVILQDDSFSESDSVTICAFTSDDTDVPLARLRVEPSASNGLRLTSRLMIDKVTTVNRSQIGSYIGTLDDTDIVRMNRALLVFLGLAVLPGGRATP